MAQATLVTKGWVDEATLGAFPVRPVEVEVAGPMPGQGDQHVLTIRFSPSQTAVCALVPPVVAEAVREAAAREAINASIAEAAAEDNLRAAAEAERGMPARG